MKYCILFLLIMMHLGSNAQVTVLPYEYEPIANMPDEYEVHRLDNDTVRYILCSEHITFCSMSYYSIEANENYELPKAELIPTTELFDMVSLGPGVYQKQRGGEIVVYGGRPEEILYVIDGMRVPRN